MPACEAFRPLTPNFCKVIQINNEGSAIVDFNGIRREVELGLVNAKIGDYVLVHAGYAIKVINEEDVKDELKNFIKSLK
ncbi:HypC/HybG/HupF family hydrogenase formation chaperone [Acidianus ambivalens]|uniref:HypC/HybG/HupF family hydrogenase formation chaperone n=1 Tax=Acidianus ambivalens TaxID=2283 RepID=A0A650CYX8_ACIAM|nr:HypC/HybG/HupF family hydrogenase formation chaperone [Acidianus ambivalens]QGR22892.1 HypC/HybG/HupF family hydrogenase formation chaperone [Acidianus ambivalens]